MLPGNGMLPSNNLLLPLVLCFLTLFVTGLPSRKSTICCHSAWAEFPMHRPAFLGSPSRVVSLGLLSFPLKSFYSWFRQSINIIVRVTLFVSSGRQVIGVFPWMRGWTPSLGMVLLLCYFSFSRGCPCPEGLDGRNEHFLQLCKFIHSPSSRSFFSWVGHFSLWRCFFGSVEIKNYLFL